MCPPAIGGRRGQGSRSDGRRPLALDACDRRWQRQKGAGRVTHPPLPLFARCRPGWSRRSRWTLLCVDAGWCVGEGCGFGFGCSCNPNRPRSRPLPPDRDERSDVACDQQNGRRRRPPGRRPPSTTPSGKRPVDDGAPSRIEIRAYTSRSPRAGYEAPTWASVRSNTTQQCRIYPTLTHRKTTHFYAAGRSTRPTPHQRQSTRVPTT